MSETLLEIEQEAWESFEVGSWEEISDLSESNSENVFLNQLNYISSLEDGKRINNIPDFIEKESSIYHLANSYKKFHNKNEKEALNSFILHLKKHPNLITRFIIEFGIKLSFQLSDYTACLFIISKDPLDTEGKFSAREKIISLYHLKKYNEVIQNFKSFYQFIKEDRFIFYVVGMSLIHLGKYKEAEGIMNRYPGNITLPKYEDKKKEYNETLKNIPQLEKKKDRLSVEEMKDLGFAYLFNSQYDKAEEIFKKAALMVAA